MMSLGQFSRGAASGWGCFSPPRAGGWRRHRQAPLGQVLVYNSARSARRCGTSYLSSNSFSVMRPRPHDGNRGEPLYRQSQYHWGLFLGSRLSQMREERP